MSIIDTTGELSMGIWLPQLNSLLINKIAPFLAEGDKILLSSPAFSFNVKNTDLGVGTLHITTSKVVWLSETDKTFGFALQYRDIHLHAICSDPSVALVPHIYMQIAVDGEMLKRIEKESIKTVEVEGKEEEEEEELEYEEETYEARFTPTSESQSSELQKIFQALSEGAALFPDEDGMEGEDGFYFNANSSEDKAAMLSSHLDSLLTIAPSMEYDDIEREAEEGQFDDAEE